MGNRYDMLRGRGERENTSPRGQIQGGTTTDNPQRFLQRKKKGVKSCEHPLNTRKKIISVLGSHFVERRAGEKRSIQRSDF